MIEQGLLVEGRIMAFIFLVISLVLFWLYTYWGKQGKELTIRTLAAIAAIPEAVGRSAEMGTPLLNSAGIASTLSTGRSAADTLAGISVMGYVASLCAQAGVPMHVFTSTIDGLPLIEETLRNAYTMEGKPEDFSTDMIEVVTTQHAFTSHWLGYLQRERPASVILVGYYAYNSVVIAEGGNTIGAMQISGTVNSHQVPFLVASTDYTLIMEEVYAAGAGITKDPDSLGAIAGEDAFKIMCLALIGLGFLLALGNITFLIDLLGI
jgi:hypothetical protein